VEWEALLKVILVPSENGAALQVNGADSCACCMQHLEQWWIPGSGTVADTRIWNSGGYQHLSLW